MYVRFFNKAYKVDVMAHEMRLDRFVIYFQSIPIQLKVKTHLFKMKIICQEKLTQQLSWKFLNYKIGPPEM